MSDSTAGCIVSHVLVLYGQPNNARSTQVCLSLVTRHIFSSVQFQQVMHAYLCMCLPCFCKIINVDVFFLYNINMYIWNEQKLPTSANVFQSPL